MANKPLTRHELDKFKCGNPQCTDPNCTTLYLHSKCHPEMPLQVSYNGGIITVSCCECEGVVTQIAVAPGQLH